MFICQISKLLAYSGWGGVQNSPPSSFPPVISISLEISPELAFELKFKPFCNTAVKFQGHT